MERNSCVGAGVRCVRSQGPLTGADVGMSFEEKLDALDYCGLSLREEFNVSDLINSWGREALDAPGLEMLSFVSARPWRGSPRSPTATRSSWQICRTSRSLLLFYALLSNYFNQAWLPNFRFKDYLGNLEFTDSGGA